MPSATPPPRTSYRRRNEAVVHLSLKDFRVWQPPSGRDWAGLPLDLISYVLQKLDPVELLTGGAAGVCSSWRHTARNEPELWSHIDMRSDYAVKCVWSHVPIYELFRAALRLSAGQCKAFWTNNYTRDDDKFLLRLCEL